MLVVIDARMIGASGHGIAEYVRDLVSGLAELPGRKYSLHLLVAKDLPPDDPLRKLPHTQVKAAFLSASEWFEVPWVLKTLRADLFHSPSFAAFPFCRIPTIYTVHDLIHLHFGSFLHKAYYRFILRPSLNKAVRVCTVSEFSRREIAQWLEWPEDKIAVVKNAIHVEDPPLDWESRLIRRGLRNKSYHFSLSSSKPHKNMPFLIRAYLAHAEKNEGAWPLVVSLTQEEVGFKHPKVVCVGRLSSDEKNALLAGAGAFYFPSLHEGFGRPPLEAATLGCPAVVSNIPVHLEILKGFTETTFLSPKNQNEWIEAFGLAENKKLEKALGVWAWERSHLARAYDQIYSES